MIAGEGCIPMMMIRFVTKEGNKTRDVIGKDGRWYCQDSWRKRMKWCM